MVSPNFINELKPDPLAGDRAETERLLVEAYQAIWAAFGKLGPLLAGTGRDATQCIGAASAQLMRVAWHDL